MDLGPQHLRMIEAIASSSSISKAAIQLDLTQPAVSTMLRRVESHLGAKLFTRTSGGVAPTPLGAEVASRARAILAGIEELDLVLAPARAASATPALRVGMQASPAVVRVGARLAAFLTDAQLQVRVDQGCGTLIALLGSGALDLGVIHEPVPQPPSLPRLERHVLVAGEPVYLGVAADSPLAGRDGVDLADLAGLDWVDDPLDDGPWPAYFRQRCAAAGFVPRVSYWTGNWELTTSLVRAGRAVTCFHPTARPRDGVVFKQLRGEPLAHRVVLVWNQGHAVPARRLRSELGRAYLELVAVNPLYLRWWNEHPDAHPELPRVGPFRKAG